MLLCKYFMISIDQLYYDALLTLLDLSTFFSDKYLSFLTYWCKYT